MKSNRLDQLEEQFMREAIREARRGMDRGDGGPFGAVVVHDGQVIGRGRNCVIVKNDPTAHAEVEAIRDACRRLESFQLNDCVIYTSCEPCPMCLGAIYWARPERMVYACTRADAAAIQFDDDFIYREISLPLEARSIAGEQRLREEALKLFRVWEEKEDRIKY